MFGFNIFNPIYLYILTSFAEENALEFTLTLNHELNNVNNWLTSNRICVNADKTK